MMRNLWLAGLAALMLTPGPALAEKPATIIVMDGSGSMWGQIEGRPKLEIARETVATVLEGLPSDQALGLLAYGHREKGNCADIELMVPPAGGTAEQIRAAVGGMRFLGKTPLSDAVRQAADALRYQEAAASVVLVTDGLETCAADPCALGRELEAAGLNFTAHVIGFGLSAAEAAQVACLAQETGGQYFDAGDAGALRAALQATVAAPEPLPEAPKQARTYFPGAPWMADTALEPTGGTTGAEATLPGAITFGATDTAQACQAHCAADGQCAAWRYEPPGSHFVAEARCFLFDAATEMDHRSFPPGEGWASGVKDGVMMLVRPWRAPEPLPAATLEATDAAPLGQPLAVRWTGPAADLDTIEIGLPGDGERWTYAYVASGNPVLLTLPGEPGAYELRYRFRDETVIASRPVLVTDAQVTLTAPDQALAGSEVAVGWVGPDADYDNVQIGPAGSQDYITYAYVRGSNPVLLTMPDTPGRYELRYKLNDAEVLATRPITVIATDAMPVADPGAAGGDAAGDGAAAAPGDPVPLRIKGIYDKVFTRWQAMPLGGQDSPVLDSGAPRPGAWETRLNPGPWAIEGRHDGAQGATYLAVIHVDAPAELTLDRPAYGVTSADPGQPFDLVCAGPAPCYLQEQGHGLRLALPAGWGMEQPVTLQTAAGVAAAQPSTVFVPLRADRGAVMAALNPRQWDAMLGPCLQTAAGPLCHSTPLPEADLVAVRMIAALLAPETPTPPVPTPPVPPVPESGDFIRRIGGTRLTLPEGFDPMDILAPAPPDGE